MGISSRVTEVDPRESRAPVRITKSPCVIAFESPGCEHDRVRARGALCGTTRRRRTSKRGSRWTENYNRLWIER
jgi:hypothetical protein